MNEIFELNTYKLNYITDLQKYQWKYLNQWIFTLEY